MDSIILSGGYGKRMGALAEEIPKSLLLVVGKPVLKYLLDDLGKFYDNFESKKTCYILTQKQNQTL